MDDIMDLVGLPVLVVMVAEVAVEKVQAMWTLVGMVAVVVQELTQVLPVLLTTRPYRYHQVQMQLLLGTTAGGGHNGGSGGGDGTDQGTVKDNLKVSYHFNVVSICRFDFPRLHFYLSSMFYVLLDKELNKFSSICKPFQCKF
jgi:hypothetical protein